jgi:hypothetical protein
MNAAKVGYQLRSPAMLIASLALLLAANSGPSSAATLRVPGQFPAIQPALNAATPGDTVLVGPGTYSGPLNRGLDFIGKDLVLCSEAGAELTIIDCDGVDRGFYFHSNETSAAVLDGFTVREGNGTPNGGGGLIEYSSPTIQNSRFIENDDSGISCAYSTVELTNLTFEGNSDSWFGGGIYAYESSMALVNSRFVGNYAGYGGGGLHASRSEVHIEGCEFSGNNAGVSGGGLSAVNGGHLAVLGASFLSNTAWEGAGAIIGVAADLTNVRFQENSSQVEGSALRVVDTALVTVSASSFVRNHTYHTGAAIHVRDDAGLSLLGCTLTENTATIESEIGGISLVSETPSRIERTVIAFHEGAGIYQSPWVPAPQVLCCDVFANAFGNYTGGLADQTGLNGNISLDPRFCLDLNAALPYGLSEDSPCLPEANACAALIGAFGLGCPTTGTTQEKSWGSIKSLY